MEIEVQKKDGTAYNTNLSSLSREIYLALKENHLLHKSADGFIVTNTIYEAVEELVGFKDN